MNTPEPETPNSRIRKMDFEGMNTNNAEHYAVKLRNELRLIYENHQHAIILIIWSYRCKKFYTRLWPFYLIGQ